jgi:hypothetical protein
MNGLNNIKLICIFLLGSVFSSNAQNLLTDLINGKTLMYESSFSEIQDVDVTYPILKGLKDSIIQKKINARIKQIFVDIPKTDSFQLSILKEAKNTLEMYKNIVNKFKKNEDDEEYNQYEKNEEEDTPSKKIEDIDFEFVSYLNSTVTLVQSIQYKIEDRTMDLDEEFYTFRIFYFNVLSGKEYKSTDVYKKTAEKQLNQLIENKVKDKMNQIDFEQFSAEILDLDEDESPGFYQEIKNTLSFNNKSLHDFSSFKDGFSFPKAFSMSYYIPAWSKCTKNIYYINMEVRLTFDEIRNYLNPEGPYASLISYRLKNETNLSNQNHPTYSRGLNDQEFKWIENIPLHNSENLKKITIKRYDKPEEKLDTSKHRYCVEIEYHKNGSIKQINEIENNSNVLFTYDDKQRIIKQAFLRNGKKSDSFEYQYDDKNNVTAIKTLEDNQYLRTVYFYYTQDSVIKETYNFINSYEEIKNSYEQKIFTKNGLLKKKTIFEVGDYSSKGTYLYEYDKNNRPIISVFLSSTSSNIVNYNYDENGILIAKESSEGTKLVQYEYDQKNNLLKHTYYNNRNLSGIKSATYNDYNQIIYFDETEYEFYPRYFTLKYEKW